MKAEKRLFFSILATILGTTCAILSSGGRYQNIADNPAFGCRWQGGISATLSCTCQSIIEEFYIQEGSIDSIDLHTISIDNCNEVKLGPKSIQNMRSLRIIRLSNIESLTLEESSLHWEGYVTNGDRSTPSLTITIEYTHITKISSYTFRGRIKEIIFDNSVIDHVAPFSFSSLTQNQNIEFRNVTLRNVQPQAFKKFSTEYLTMANLDVDQLPSRAFSELVVTENFLIRNSTFQRITSGGFSIHNPRRFEVLNSQINTLEGEGFKVTTRGDVEFKNNVFKDIHVGAFLSINVNFREIPVRKIIVFDGITVYDLQAHTLDINTTSFESKITNILLRETCQCGQVEIGNVYQLEEIKCLEQNVELSYQDFLNKQCSLLRSNATIIITSCVILILIIVIGSVMVFYFKKVYGSGRYGDEKKDESNKLSMIVPDGRTYRETELHVIVERTDLLTTDL